MSQETHRADDTFARDSFQVVTNVAHPCKYLSCTAPSKAILGPEPDAGSKVEDRITPRNHERTKPYSQRAKLGRRGHLGATHSQFR